MSSNTQAQGRTLYTERDFTFTPLSTDDSVRAGLRWEMELQRQLYTGDVTKDGAAKQLALDAPYLKPFTFSPTSVTGLALTTTVAANATLVTVNTTGMTASVTAGTLPTGTTLSVSGSTVKLTGTATNAGAFSFTVSVAKDGFVTKTFTVAGTVTVGV